MRKKLTRMRQVGSLTDEPIESARKILLACVPATMSFWVDHNARIHGAVPEQVPAGAESLLVGTYSIGGTSLALIEADILAERRQRAAVWID